MVCRHFVCVLAGLSGDAVSHQQFVETVAAEQEWREELEAKHPSLRAWPGKETMNKFAPAFIKAKRAFGPALKDKTNPAFRSKYADLGACIDAVEDALLENSIAFIQETFEDATGVTVETVFLHESGETMRCGRLHVPASKQDPQGYGSALTYARRYSLMAACGIAPEDDDGNAAKGPKPVIAASFRSSPTMGAMDSVDDERKTYLELLASVLTNKVKTGYIADAYEKLEKEKFDSDEKTALWSILDSKTRAAIKAHAETLKTKQELETL